METRRREATEQVRAAAESLQKIRRLLPGPFHYFTAGFFEPEAILELMEAISWWDQKFLAPPSIKKFMDMSEVYMWGVCDCQKENFGVSPDGRVWYTKRNTCGSGYTYIAEVHFFKSPNEWVSKEVDELTSEELERLLPNGEPVAGTVFTDF